MEGLPDLPLCDPPRQGVFAGVLLAEAEHEVLSAGLEDGCEALCEERSVLVGEDVEEAGVDDGIKRPPEPGKVERVPDPELCLNPPPGGLLLGLPDREGGGVDPEHLVASLREEEGMLPRPAPYIEDGARNLSRRGEVDERRLGPADVPGRRALVDRVEDIHAE